MKDEFAGKSLIQKAARLKKQPKMIFVMKKSHSFFPNTVLKPVQS